MSSNIGKRKRGMIERERYHKLKSEKDRQSHVSGEKERAIRVALEHFKMI